MNQYLLLRRVRGPLILVTIGVMALLDQYGALSFGRSWPLLLIVVGILQLGERLALAQMPAPPPPGGFYAEGCGVPMAPMQPGAGPAGSEHAAQSQEERKY